MKYTPSSYNFELFYSETLIQLFDEGYREWFGTDLIDERYGKWLRAQLIDEAPPKSSLTNCFWLIRTCFYTIITCMRSSSNIITKSLCSFKCVSLQLEKSKRLRLWFRSAKNGPRTSLNLLTIKWGDWDIFFQLFLSYLVICLKDCCHFSIMNLCMGLLITY